MKNINTQPHQGVRQSVTEKNLSCNPQIILIIRKERKQIITASYMMYVEAMTEQRP